MNMWTFVFTLLSTVVCILFGLKLAFVGMIRATNKGYRHMQGVGICVYFFVCFTLGWNCFVLLQSGRLLTFFQAMGISGIIVGPVSGFAVTLLAALLAANPSRHAPLSKAHIPFAQFGYLLLFLGPALGAILYIRKILPPSPSLRVAFLSITIGLALLGLGRKSRLPRAAEVLKLDPRPPVLYLRAFAREKDVFAKVSNDGQDFPDRPRGEQPYRTVEEFLGREINRDIGPFVALGSPLDFVPQDGAARLYAEDETWTQDFTEIAHKAQRVLLLPNYSGNLEFELHCALYAGWVHKLRVMTRPALRLTNWEIGTWRVATWFAGDFATQRVAAHDWDRFTKALLDVGFGVDKDLLKMPAPGSVFAFAPDRRIFLLRSGLNTPNEFVSALREGPSIGNPSQPALFSSLPPFSAAPAQIPKSRSAGSVIGAMSVLCVLAASLFGNAFNVRNFIRDRQNSMRVASAFAASPDTQKPFLLIHGDQSLYMGARIQTTTGAGVFKREDTGSVAVIIGEGQTGLVMGPVHGAPGIVNVLWAAQQWEEDSWVSTWGLPGFYHKRYTRLPAFMASINADWVELTHK